MTIHIARAHIHRLVLVLLSLGLMTSYGAATADQSDAPPPSLLDRRHEQVGTWDCSGVTTAPYGTERPYHGVLTNTWTLDGAWLRIHFEEQQAVTERPMIEDQYWGYDVATNSHTRTLMVNDGSYGLVHSTGWLTDTLPWNGTFTSNGTTYQYEETIEHFSETSHRQAGALTTDGRVALYYDVTCTRR